MEQLLSLSEVHALVRLLFGATLGTMIGLERQWRQKMAGGLQTCALVAAGATLFTVITLLAGPSANKLQIAAAVVTGVGFLAGGVILKQGINVRGLNTAATIWATAAVGCLAGLGWSIEATAGAAAIVGLNLFLGPVADHLDRRGTGLRETDYKIETTGQADAEAAVDDLLNDAIRKTWLRISSKNVDRAAQEDALIVTVQLRGRRRDTALVRDLVNRIRALPGVTDSMWSAQESDVQG